MSVIFLQRTVAREISLAGVGLHTGHEGRITFQPAPINSGLVFVVGTGDDAVEIPALIENLPAGDGSVRNTALRHGDAAIYTVEHVLAALTCSGITNCRILLDSDEVPEPPDGGAVAWLDILEEAGIKEQGVPANFYRIPATIRFRDGDVEIVAEPANDFSLTVHIDYDDPLIGVQEATFRIDRSTFREEIAPARTFVMKSDVVKLREQGFALGGTLQNAVVVDDGALVGDQKLRFSDEFVRHKMLDLLGDLALLGMPLLGHVTARCSGHATNAAFVRLLAGRERRSPRLYPLRKPECWDIGSIMKVMPHRYPFLLVDRIIELEPGKRVVGIKNVTINEPFFQGHFPDHPIMPAVLIVEAMAQVGGVMLLSGMEDPDSKLVYFGGIDRARFRQPVIPGDQIRFELELIKSRGPICKMSGVAFVDGRKVAEAEMISSVVER